MELTQNQARRLALGAQGLLDRFEQPIEAVAAVVAVQSQYSVSLLPALHARAKSVTPRRVERMLAKDRTLVKSWNLRHTLHCFRSEDMALFGDAMGESLCRRFQAWMAAYDIFSADEHAEIEAEIVSVLASGPLTREELHARVARLQRIPHAGWGADIKGLAYAGRLVMCEQGASRSKFALTEQWLGSAPESGRFTSSDLLRRYLRGHGLATAADFRYWVGVTHFDVKTAIAGLGEEVRTVTYRGAPYLVLADAQVPEDRPPTTCRFLAKFDPLIMGWKDKSLFLPPKYADQVIRPAAQIEATLLLDGKIVGTWRLDRKGIINLFPFAPIATGHQARIEREGLRLLKAMGYPKGEVKGL